MRLGWDEIKRRARAFSEEWKDAHSDRDRVEHLFARYEALVSPLATTSMEADRRIARQKNQD